jgi:CheY-like chemotaxis protein
MSDDSTALKGRAIGVGTSGKPKIRIVVADDHPIFREGLCKLLALEQDFDVVAQAQDGQRALEVLHQFEPDILLLDLKMPGLDGLATLQRLQAAKNKTRSSCLRLRPIKTNSCKPSGWEPRALS